MKVHPVPIVSPEVSMPRTLPALALFALVAAPSIASAAAPQGVLVAPPAPSFSLTISPLHLALPVLEAQLEVALDPRMSVSVVLGYGGVTVSDGFTEDTFSVFEAGAQFAYYAVGDFGHGLQLGLEALYVGVSADADSEFSGVFGRGFALSPFIGYKIAADFGLTFMAQLGPAFTVVSAESDTDSAEDSGVGVLLNLNVGWSF